MQPYRSNTSKNGSVRSIAAFMLLAASVAFAQTPGDGAIPAAGSGDARLFTQEELDQMLAPIALYPDALLSQIFMAATYPIEIVQADRWVRENSKLKGDSLTNALEQRSWDPSVKSLVNFPQVLAMMSEQLDWTTNLGDAVLGQEKQVMDTVQKLRAKAQAQGNLATTSEQTVVVQQAPAAPTQTIIVIESANPQVVYVPVYDPVVVYGSWWYPAYPPYHYYPPGYVAGARAVSFGVGLAVGAAWGYAWGGCNWHHGDIDVDINRNTFVNNRIDRSRYRNTNVQGNRGAWQHDPAHRRGHDYRDRSAAQRYGGRSAAETARERDAYRGRTDAGRRDLARGDADQFKRGPDAAGARNRDTNRDTNRDNRANRGPSTAPDRRPAGPSASDRADRGRSQTTDRGGAFDGVDRGRDVKSQSQRGQSSRAAPARPSGGSYGGSRGGGGARGGGGGRR